MTATTIPADLASHRERMMAKTGLVGDAYGIAPDESHKAGGGYHCGRQDIINIGKFHFPVTSNIGSSTEDYSERLLRDREVGGNEASAEDIGDNWPHGGRAAWLRFNNLTVKQLQAGDPLLSAIREVNFSPDGTARKRWDAQHPTAGVNSDGIIDSTDSVYMHTHFGFYRNTAGTLERFRTLLRIEQIADAAIANRPLPNEEDDEMGASTPPIDIKVEGVTSLAMPEVNGGTADPRPAWLRVVNDTGGRPGQTSAPDYALRIVGVNAGGAWSAFVKDTNGTLLNLVKFKSGRVQSFAIPSGITGLSIIRAAIAEDGSIIDPTQVAPAGAPTPYADHLTCCIERGPVKTQ